MRESDIPLDLFARSLFAAVEWLCRLADVVLHAAAL